MKVTFKTGALADAVPMLLVMYSGWQTDGATAAGEFNGGCMYKALQ